MDGCCAGPDKGLNFDCNAYKNNAFNDDKYKSYTYTSNSPWKNYWVDKGQELRKFNEETKLPEIWVAQKDILDLKDIYSRYLERQEEIAERKLITAQANFKLLNL